MKARGSVIVSLVGLGLLLLAWSLVQPRYSAPDEGAHYVKAVGVARGDLVGTPTGDEQPTRYIDRTRRTFDIPQQQAAPVERPCYGFEPNTTAGCTGQSPPTSTTPMGTYPPFIYGLFGILPTIVGRAETGMYAARFSSVALNLIILTGAVASARTPTMRVAVAASVAPMTLFLASVVNPNGVEISGATTFAVTSFAIAGGRSRRGDWFWWAVGGSACALGKSLGVGWLVLIGALALAASDTRPVAIVREVRRHLVAVAVVVVSSFASLLWTIAVMPKPEAVTKDLLDTVLRVARGSLDYLGRGSVGIFGWVDTRFTEGVYVAVLLAVLVAVAAALWRATWRERFLILAWPIGVVLVSAYVIVTTQFPSGFGGQARFTLALLPPYWCLLARPFRGRSARLGHLAVVLGIAALQMVALWTVGHRYAVGAAGPWWFFPAAEWSPPGGWFVVMMLGVLGILLWLLPLGLSAVQSSRRT